METKKNDVQKAQENVLVNNVIEKTKEVKLTLQQQLEKELQRLTLKKELADKRAFFILKKCAAAFGGRFNVSPRLHYWDSQLPEKCPFARLCIIISLLKINALYDRC